MVDLGSFLAIGNCFLPPKVELLKGVQDDAHNL